MCSRNYRFLILLMIAIIFASTVPVWPSVGDYCNFLLLHSSPSSFLNHICLPILVHLGYSFMLQAAQNRDTYKGTFKSFSEWKIKTNKTKQGKIIPFTTLKITSRYPLYTYDIADKAAGMIQRRPLSISSEAQISHIIGCLYVYERCGLDDFLQTR